MDFWTRDRVVFNFAFLLIGLDFIQAAASGKLLNFVSNIVSLITFYF